MELSKIEIGAVFRFPHDERPNRVLVHNGDVVMYDSWWPHLGGWGLADLKSIRRRHITYYVTTVPTVLDKATYLRSEPLSAGEHAVHRPDLPFVALRNQAMTWSDPLDRPGEQTATLPAEALYLFPFGPSGGTKAAIRITPDDGRSFSAEELFHKAQNVQGRHVMDTPPVAGVGIYRSGLQRGLPAYYLWGAESRMHETSRSTIMNDAHPRS